MDGRSHERLTFLTLLATAPLPGAALGGEGLAAYLAGGVVSAWFFSPDLDLPDSRPAKRWGVLNVFWAPYRWLHPHRGASHTYLYGPLSRLVYASLVVLVATGLTTQDLGWLWKAAQAHPQVAVGAVAGFLVGQWAHLWQDGILPFGGRRRRRRWR